VSRITGAAVRWAGARGAIRDRAPRLGFVQKDLRRIWPGASIDDALDVAIDLHVLGVRTVYTWLAEPAAPSDAADADAVLATYLEVLARIATAEIDGDLSVSPVQLGADLDADACLGRLIALASAGEAQGSWLWLESAGSGAVDQTLDLYQRLRASQGRTGVCLQANLRRTARDVEALLPLAPGIRLVKGESDEGREVALQDEGEVDANYMAMAVTLLRESRTRPIRLALATHDTSLVDQIASHAAAAGVGKDRFEIQMRYGVRPKEQRRLARGGYAVQTLIAFGPGWYPWYVRLLADRPSNALVALRQALPG
jgi:proline dehydrogenase